MKLEQALKIIQQNKTAYNLIGEEFAATRQRLWPEIELLVKKYVNQNNKVLDIGCGNGRLLKVLPKVNYWGIDVSTTLLSRAEELADELNFEQVNFKNLDMLELDKLSENDFDVVFMLASFNHLPSKELRLKVLGEVKKKLRPGGWLIMTNWNMRQWDAKKSVWRYKIIKPLKHKNIKTNYGLDFKDVMTVWQNGAGDKQGELYYRAFTLGELKRLFKKSGFMVLENYYALNGKKARWFNGHNIVSVAQSLAK